MERKQPVDVKIRPFEPTDHERVRWLFARTPPWGRTYPRPQPLPDDLEDIPTSYPNGGAFVATEDDMAGEAVVGHVAVRTATATEVAELPDFIQARKAISRIHWVSVAPERWRLGIGRRLTEKAIEWSRQNGCEAVILETTLQQEAASALYESLGFVEKGRTTNGPWRQVWFELVL